MEINAPDVDPVRIIHITGTSSGGAYIAAQRINTALQKSGQESSLVMMNDSKRLAMNRSRIERKVDHTSLMLSDNEMTTSTLKMYSSSRDFDLSIENSDIVNLHWIPGLLHHNFFSKLKKASKIVWTLHDMNPFTGICHHSFSCRRYEESCKDCPQLSIGNIHLASQIQKKKCSSIQELGNFEVVAPSHWLKDQARASRILESVKISVIPNPSPNSFFELEVKSDLGIRLGLDRDSVVIGVLGGNYGRAKGGQRALEEIHRYQQISKKRIQVLIFGTPFSEMPNVEFVATSNHPSENFAEMLQLCNVYVHFSEADNLPNILIEAQSLGVPVIALDRGGVSEAFEDKVSGFLIREAKDFSSGMEWLFQNENRVGFKLDVRSFASRNFQETAVASQYMRVYSSD